MSGAFASEYARREANNVEQPPRLFLCRRGRLLHISICFPELSARVTTLSHILGCETCVIELIYFNLFLSTHNFDHK